MQNGNDPAGDRTADPLGPCPICGREMIPGSGLDRHHWVPRSAGGRAWDWMHLVCHRMIHRFISEEALATTYADADALRAHPDMARFIAWVRRKPTRYVDWPKSPRRRRR